MAAPGARLTAAKLLLWPTALSVLEWGLLAAAIGLWISTRSFTPAAGAGSVLLLASWAARWLRTGALTRPSAADFPLIVFLLSALVGLWATPSLGPGLVRLFLFIGAAGLYFGVVNASGITLSAACAALTAMAAVVGVYFMTQNPWAGAGAKFGAVQQVGVLLNQWVPDLGGYKPHPNVVAGLLGALMPVAVLQTAEAARPGPRGRTRLAGFASAAVLAVIAMALVMTESRASWIGLMAAAALGLWWWLAGKAAGGARKPDGHLMIFGAGVLAVLAGIVAGLWWRAEWVVRAFGNLPGPNSAISRVEVFRQVWRLAQDTPFTGGGLDAFPALYSTYILDIPSLLLTHAHNAYLNLLVEQGWPGMLGYFSVLAAAAMVGLHYLANEPAAKWQRVAGLMGLAVVAIQSLGDASLVASRVIPVLFVPAALALADPTSVPWPRPHWARWARWVLVSVVLLALAGAAVYGRELVVAWRANMGAVAYARAQLSDWPTGVWSGPEEEARLAPAEDDLRDVLALDSDNRTARLRLGAAALTRWDFPAAANYLEPAYRADPAHRGLAKYLAYTYVWLGEYNQAQPLLVTLPEAASEMEVYTWWWGVQGRNDLAERARAALAKLQHTP